MDAVKFLEEWKRMCDVTERTQCGAKYYCIHSNGNAPYKMMAHNDFVKTVCDWSESHPCKTRLQDFLEKYPNAPLNNDGFPVSACPFHLGYEPEGCDGKHCVECWNKPLED